MKKIQRLLDTISKSEAIKVVKQSKSKSDVCRFFDLPINGTGHRFVTQLINRFDIDISHFDLNFNNRKYPLVKKACPVCGTKFEASKGHPKEKQTCSYGCANTYFRSKYNNGQYKDGRVCNSPKGYAEPKYRKICFSVWERKCCICDWTHTVDVHHIDKNHDNNEIENLVPLCANHHRMMHDKKESGFHKQVLDIVKQRIPAFV